VFQNLIQQALSYISRIGSDPNDDDNIRLQKSLLVVCAFFFMVAGFAWSLMYFFFNEPLAGSIPFSYGIFSLLSVLYFARTHQYAFFCFSQLLLILLLPFLLMVTLGGFINGSAVVQLVASPIVCVNVRKIHIANFPVRVIHNSSRGCRGWRPGARESRQSKHRKRKNSQAIKITFAA